MTQLSSDTDIVWPASVRIPVAWGDMDAFAHVNNTVYFRWFESARIALFDAVGINERMRQEQIGPILAETSCRFLLPLRHPDTIVASARVVSVRTTSFQMAYRITSEVHGVAAVAIGDGRVVMFDYRRQTKIAVDDALRARLLQE